MASVYKPYGKPSRPVSLDMFQNITNVSWPKYRWGILTYEWSGPGKDLDTRTQLKDRSAMLGWGRDDQDEGYMKWGGDTVGTSGLETILFDLKALRELMRKENGGEGGKDASLSVSMAAFWWNDENPSGTVNLKYAAYKGGDPKLHFTTNMFYITSYSGEPLVVETSGSITMHTREEETNGQSLGSLSINYDGEGKF